MKKVIVKSPNVENVLEALNTIEISIQDMNKSEIKELSGFLDQLAGAFQSNAPEETIVPHIDEVTMRMSDVAKTLLDSYGLAS